MYRVPTDPVSKTPHDASPWLYRITQAMRTMLQIWDDYFRFPRCTAQAATSEIDHIRSFEHGEPTFFDNLRTPCKHHRRYELFRDDRSRAGNRQNIQIPNRAAVRLYGWSPPMAESGVVCTSPLSGTTHKNHMMNRKAPRYPKRLRKLFNCRLRQQHPARSMPP
jgi:hypothetical protein